MRMNISVSWKRIRLRKESEYKKSNARGFLRLNAGILIAFFPLFKDNIGDL